MALLTDLYQFTMAQGYWQAGKADQEAVFHLFFRKNPFQGGFTLAAGLADALAFLQTFQVKTSNLAYLAELQRRDGQALFAAAFLDYLRAVRFTCDVDAMPEGTGVLHPGVKRFTNPHQYPAGLELSLHELKMRLILRARGEA